jgi:hypothetical protein
VSQARRVMPLPVYHRELGCAELSTRTAMTLSPDLSCFVMSYTWAM